MTVRLPYLATLVMVLVTAGTAAAQGDSADPAPSEGEPTEAERHYELGLKEFKGGNYPVACQHFAASYEIEPLAGVLFTLATCEVRAGRIATGAARFREYLALVQSLSAEASAKQQERVAVAERELKKIEPEVPHLVIEVRRRGNAKVEVRLDGEPLPKPKVGERLPLDPGKHVVTLLVDGAVAEERSVFLEKREFFRLELGPTPTAGPAPATPPPQPAPQVVVHQPDRTWTYVAAGVGVAGIGVGSITGALVLADQGTIRDHCDGPACDATGKETADSAQAMATVSNIAFAIGIAASATAVVLYLTEPDAPERPGQVALGLRPGGIDLRGTF